MGWILKLFPGIPEVASQEYIQFTSSFWPSLYAGMISGLFTGIVVGLIVWGIQRRTEARRVKREYSEALSMFQQEVFQALTVQSPVDIGSFDLAIPDGIKKLDQLIRTHPVHVWQRHLGKEHRKFFDALSTCHSLYTEQRRNAAILDGLVRHRVRMHLHSTKTHSGIENDDIGRRYFVGRSIGFPDSKLLPFIGLIAHHDEIPPWVIECYKAVRSDEKIDSALSEYLKTHHRMVQATEALIEAVGSSIKW